MILLLMTLAGLAQVQALCKPGWQSWGGKCFFMSTATKNW